MGTNDGYAKGLIDGAEAANEELYNKGKNEFMKTKEYQDILQNTYDQGYDDGTAGASSPATYIVPIAVLCGLILFYVFLSKRASKKKK